MAVPLKLSLLVAVLYHAAATSASAPRDVRLDESWKFFYGPGDNETFFLEKLDDSSWTSINVPHDWSALPLPPRQDDRTNAPVLEIRNGTWLFKRGDNPTYSNISLDDSAWQPTQVPGDWRDPPLNYEEINAFGWYRRHFSAADWQVAAAAAGNLYVALGAVSAADDTFINGVKVGTSMVDDPKGLFCPNYGTYRQYSVPPFLLKAGSADNNVIAVRVLSQGGKAGVNTSMGAFPGGLYDISWGDQRVGALDPGASSGQKATGYAVGGTGWYRRTLATPPPASGGGGRVFLRFDGVYMNSDTWVNGVHLGNHPYGYTTYQYDVTELLHAATGAENIVAVRVKNSGKNSRWYSGSGIYRHVWLTTTPPLHIQLWGVGVATQVKNANTTAAAATAIVTVTVENLGKTPSNAAVLSAALVGPDGSMVGTQLLSVASLAAGASRNVTLPVFDVTSPLLWGLDTPELYTVRVALKDNITDAEDIVTETFGFRSISFSVDKGFQLNGKELNLQGGCVHHDNGIIGASSIDAAEYRQVATLKNLGYNAIRTAHNPVSEAFLHAADTLGMLIMEEAFDCWTEGKNPDDYHNYFQEWWRRDVYAFVRRDRNRPSIVMWSIGNEIPMKDTSEGIALSHNISDWIREIDPGSGRAITSAIAGLKPSDDPYISALDVSGYNYADHWSDGYSTDHERVPDRIMLGTESFPSASFQMWDSVWNDTYVIGDFIWSAIDYYGESGLGSSGFDTWECGGFTPDPFPYHISFCGDVDVAGGRKPQSHFRSVLWNHSKLEMVVGAPGKPQEVAVWGWEDARLSWTWPGWDGQVLTVQVYSQYPAVMIFLNGVKVSGPNKVGYAEKFTFTHTVTYTPGELVAVPCMPDGTQLPGVANVTLRTAGKPASLALSTDYVKLPADRRYLAYVTATVVDANGTPVPTASGLPGEYQYGLPVVDIAITTAASPPGAGHLYALGTGDPVDANPTVGAGSRRAYRGVVVAVIQPGGAPGTVPVPGVVKVTASAAGMPDTTIDIVVHE